MFIANKTITLTDVRSPSPAPEWARTHKQRSGRIPERSYSSREPTFLTIFHSILLSSCSGLAHSHPWIPPTTFAPSTQPIHPTNPYPNRPSYSSAFSSHPPPTTSQLTCHNHPGAQPRQRAFQRRQDRRGDPSGGGRTVTQEGYQIIDFSSIHEQPGPGAAENTWRCLTWGAQHFNLVSWATRSGKGWLAMLFWREPSMIDFK